MRDLDDITVGIRETIYPEDLALDQSLMVLLNEARASKNDFLH